jgi:uncharacterized protein YecE (DUF72 family)
MPDDGQPAGAHIRIGCSGWVYRHWKEDFYAGIPQRLWFHHYANRFDTVEINASFYRTPAPSMWEAWKAKAPPGFRYAVKANRFITHLKKLAGVEEATAQFIDLARALGPHLGPILYQLPPNLKRNPDRLEAFLALLPQDLEHAVEFRSSDWYDADILALLDRFGVGFVAHDLVGLASPRWGSGRTAYVRFHGTGGKYVGRYSQDEMAQWARWLVDQRAAGRSAWAYFNNDIHGDAIRDAAALRLALEQLGETADGLARV